MKKTLIIIALLLSLSSCMGLKEAWNEQECEPYVVEYYNEKTGKFGIFETSYIYTPGRTKRIEFYGPKVLILDIKFN